MKKFSKLLVFVFSLVFFAASYAGHHNTGMRYRNVIAAAKSDPNLSTFVIAVQKAGLTRTLQRRRHITVFAPTNRAFSNMPRGMFRKLMQPQNRRMLRIVLLNHVTSNRVMSPTIRTGRFKSLNGHMIVVTQKGRRFYLNNLAKISRKDIRAKNGTVRPVTAVIVVPTHLR